MIRLVFPKGFLSKALDEDAPLHLAGFAVVASVAGLEEPGALAALSGDLRTMAWKRSCTDLCLPLKSLALEILTGEPLTLIKALVLLTDFLRGTFDVPLLTLLGKFVSMGHSLGRSGESGSESESESGCALGGL